MCSLKANQSSCLGKTNSFLVLHMYISTANKLFTQQKKQTNKQKTKGSAWYQSLSHANRYHAGSHSFFIFVRAREEPGNEAPSVIRGPEVPNLIDSHSAQQSFIPSPPYTPYQSPTKHISFDHTTGSLYVNTYPTPYSSGQPSPVERFQRSLSPSETSGDGQYGSPPAHLSPPYSNATVGSPYQEEEGICIVSEATQFTTPCPCDIKTPTSSSVQVVRPSPVDPSTVGYQSAKIEFPSAPSTVGQPTSLPVRHTVIESTYVNKARMRYSTVANGGPTGHMSQIRNDREATESISQWSQWLKGGAPAPVC